MLDRLRKNNLLFILFVIKKYDKNIDKKGFIKID